MQHVVEEDAEIGLIDARSQLHGAGGEADFMANDALAPGHLALHPGALHRIAVGHREPLGAGGELGNGLSGLLRFVELLGPAVDGVGGEDHGIAPRRFSR